MTSDKNKVEQCFLKLLYNGHTRRKWYTFSITFTWQCMQSISALLMLKCLPFSLRKSCDENLNRVKAVLYLRIKTLYFIKIYLLFENTLYQLYVDTLINRGFPDLMMFVNYSLFDVVKWDIFSVCESHNSAIPILSSICFIFSAQFILDSKFFFHIDKL